MLRFILTRVSLVIPTFLGITLLAFFLIRLVPGDPIETHGGRARHRRRSAMRSCWHGVRLRPAGLVQYGIYLGSVLHGDLGKSIITQEPVLDEFSTLFPATIELALCAMLFALVLGLPAGILAAVKRNSIFDHGVMGVVAHRLFDADLLVGPAADPAVLGAARLDAGLGPHRRCSYYFEPVTGFMLIDSLLSRREGRLPLGAVAPDPADHRARHRPARGDRAHDALGHARGAGRGLHPHRPRQGPAAAAGSSACTRCATR